MQTNLLVLRPSPDWMNFDLENTREFLRRFRLPETLIIEFDQLWRRYFRGDFRSIRAQLKALAAQTFKDVRYASLLKHEDWDGSANPAGWISFVDDDDWMAPALFESLPPPKRGDDGILWGSVRLGRVFSEDGYNEPILQARPLDRTVYTNNYAVTARALGRFGPASLFEHRAAFGSGGAQATFDEPDFVSACSQDYLSCAVKHPCCTMSVSYLMTRDDFRSDPRREMAKFMLSLESVRPEGFAEWLAEPFRRFRTVMADALAM